MQKRREEFKLYKNKDGEYFREQSKEGNLDEVTFAVKKPNHQQQKEANFVYSKYMNQYLKGDIMPQLKMEEILKQNGIWDESKRRKEEELVTLVRDVNEKLRRGGIKLSEGAKLAKEAIKARFDLMELSAIRTNFLQNSAENLSQNHRFNYLVSECTVYSNDKKVFKDYEDFLNQDNLGSQLPYLAGEVFSKLIYGFDEDFRKDWPEYKFLQKYKFVNDKFDFVDKEGNVVDMEGNKVDRSPSDLPEKEVEPVFLPDDESKSEVKVEEKKVEELVKT